MSVTQRYCKCTNKLYHKVFHMLSVYVNHTKRLCAHINTAVFIYLSGTTAMSIKSSGPNYTKIDPLSGTIKLFPMVVSDSR